MSAGFHEAAVTKHSGLSRLADRTTHRSRVRRDLRRNAVQVPLYVGGLNLNDLSTRTYQPKMATHGLRELRVM